MRPASLLLLAISLLVSGCALESDTPLSSQKNAPRDQRLVGMWHVREKDNKSTDSSYMYITYGPGNIGSLIIVGNNNGNLLSANPTLMTYTFFVTKTAKNSYVNLRPGLLEPGSNASGVVNAPSNTYQFARYRFRWQGDLAFAVVNGKAFAAAVKSGALPGKTDNNGNTTILHAHPGQLLKFIETSNPKDVFEPETSTTYIGK